MPSTRSDAQALTQIYREINVIVKNSEENDTSFFQNCKHLLQCFQNYLNCFSFIPEDSDLKQLLLHSNVNVFSEKINSKIIGKCPKFIYLLRNGQFAFSAPLLNPIYIRNIDTVVQILKDVNLVEVIFLLYLCEEVKKQKIFPKNFRSSINAYNKNLYILDEVTKVLGQFSQINQRKILFHSTQVVQSDEPRKCPFSINEEKFIKLLALKSMTLKLQQEAIYSEQQSYAQQPSFCNNQNDQLLLGESQENKHYENKENKNYENRENKNYENKIDHNLSMISSESNYQNDTQEQLGSKLKRLSQSLVIIPLKLNPIHFGVELKHLTNQQIFKHVNLRKSTQIR